MDLVYEFLELGIELYTSLEVIEELEDDQQSTLRSHQKLTILSIDNIDVLEELGNTLSPGLSPADISVFHHATHINSGILTGDNLLRKVSVKLGFEVHGIIWVLDELVNNTKVLHKEAIEKLQLLMNYNKRLPLVECEKMIKKWSD